MYHIVPEIRSSNYIVVHWDCHGVMRLVTSNSYIYYFHGHEVGLPTVHHYYYYHDTFRG